MKPVTSEGVVVRVVIDTNVAISALLWNGAPRRILMLARSHVITLFVSREMIAELQQVLNRPYFRDRLDKAGLSADEVLVNYCALANLVRTKPAVPVVPGDADDDEIIACAVAADAEYLVSGDHHLLELGHHQTIQIVSTGTFLERFAGV